MGTISNKDSGVIAIQNVNYFYGKATKPDFVSYSWIDQLVDFKYWK
jgi:hypothetical protein